MPRQRCLEAISNARMHRGCRPELQLRCHPKRCWQHLSDGATAWSRANDSDVRAYLPRTFDGLPLRANVQAESDLKCTHAPRLPGRAAALLARGCVAGAIVRMWDCWSRANGAVSAYMPRAFSLAACFCAPATVPGSDLKCTHAPWLPARAAASLSPEAVLAASERWCYCLEPRK